MRVNPAGRRARGGPEVVGGAARPARGQPLLIGDQPRVCAPGHCLRAAGLGVSMATADEAHRERARAAGLEVAAGAPLAAATGAEELEGVTDLLLLTGEVDLPVFRLAPDPDGYGVVAGEAEGEVLFDPALTATVIAGRYARGAALVTRPAAGGAPDGYDVLFVVRPDGRLVPVTAGRTPTAGDDDTLVLLGQVPVDARV